MIKLFLLTLISIFALTSCTTTQKKLDSKCYSQPKTGKCKAMINKYYFDFNSGTCKTFIWGGCGGNVPFQTMKECKKSCE
jgi:hypothetical protein